MKELGYLNLSERLIGPVIVIIAEKEKDVNLNQELDKDTRWPTFLYTGYDTYRKRPSVFPINVGRNYS